jgi:hypothetical protein
MAIQISGFNNIDFGALADAIVASERTPLTTLETSKTNLETKNTAFGTLASKLSALQTAFATLGKSTSMAGLSVSSSDSGVGVSAGSGSVSGTYDVVVSQLAKQQVTVSKSTYGSSDDIVASGGTLVLRDGQGNDSVITVTGPLKLSELAAAINAKDTAPVNASVVQTAPGSFQLVFTGRTSGSREMPALPAISCVRCVSRNDSMSLYALTSLSMAPLPCEVSRDTCTVTVFVASALFSVSVAPGTATLTTLLARESSRLFTFSSAFCACCVLSSTESPA